MAGLEETFFDDDDLSDEDYWEWLMDDVDDTLCDDCENALWEYRCVDGTYRCLPCIIKSGVTYIVPKNDG